MNPTDESLKIALKRGPQDLISSYLSNINSYKSNITQKEKQILQFKEYIKNFSSVNLNFTNQSNLYEQVQNGNFKLAYFDSKRTNSPQPANSITRVPLNRKQQTHQGLNNQFIK